MERCDAKELKKILRKEVRAKIETLDPEYCIQADRDIFKQVTELEAYKQGKAIFCFVGTKGEIEADMKSNLIRVREFGKGEETIDVGKLSSDLKGHGGGDSGIVKDFLEMLLTGAQPNDRTTTLEHSMESHFIALAAEESRLHGGQVVDLEEFRARP